MKRMLLCAALIFGINAIAFSQETVKTMNMEMWFTTGGAFGNYFIIDSKPDNGYIGSPGINLSFYSLFGEKNIGLFFNYGILFPAVNNTGKDYDSSIQLDFILLGAGFGYDINETIKLHFGIGPNLTFFAMTNSENSNAKATDSIIGLGIGGDAGIKLSISKFLCMDIGTTLVWNFAVFREISSEIKGDDGWRHIKTESSGWWNTNSIIGIKPYIAIGFNLDTKKLGQN